MKKKIFLQNINNMKESWPKTCHRFQICIQFSSGVPARHMPPRNRLELKGLLIILFFFPCLVKIFYVCIKYKQNISKTYIK